jgi:hypothetical protein
VSGIATGAGSPVKTNSERQGSRMSEHRATIQWMHKTGDFLKGRYSREHTWSFDGASRTRADVSS